MGVRHDMIGSATGAPPHSDERRTRFADLYQCYHGRLIRYAWRRVGPDRAEDLVSETFTIAWRRLDDIPAGTELPWLFRTAHNLVLSSERTARRDVRALPGGYPAWAPDPAEAVGERQAAFAALARLSPADRHLVQLVAWEGLDAAGIARLLDCSRASVYLRLHRLRGRLANLLDTASEERPS
jgi:RNA polymerase sigma-70 factor (ECF subfamily)